MPVHRAGLQVLKNRMNDITLRKPRIVNLTRSQRTIDALAHVLVIVGEFLLVCAVFGMILLFMVAFS